MENNVYHVLPDSPVSVLELFSTSKEGIVLFASKVINEVEAGNADPLRVQIFCKTLEAVAEKIKEGIKDNAKREAAKYGDKPFMHAGAELHLTSTYTAYEYGGCGDPQWEQADQQVQSATNTRKEREAFLRALGEPIDVLNSDSGEVNIIRPPVKKVTEGVRVTIK